MTKEQIAVLLERVDSLPLEAHAEIVQSMLDVVQRHEGLYRLSGPERRDVDEALAEIERGDPPASDEAVKALFRKYGA